MGLFGFCSAVASSFGTGVMSTMKLGSSRGYHQPYGEGDDHRFWCILVIRFTLDFVPNIQKTLAPFKTHQIETQSRGHFRVAVKGTYCLCLNNDNSDFCVSACQHMDLLQLFYFQHISTVINFYKKSLLNTTQLAGWMKTGSPKAIKHGIRWAWAQLDGQDTLFLISSII